MARKTDIRLRRSAVAGSVPSESQLNLGELALNTADGALYFKKSVEVDGNTTETIITAHNNGILHIDSTNSRVGIGTLTPSSKLDVAGGIIASGDSAFGATAVTANGSKRTVHINDDTHGSALRLSQGFNSSLIRYDDTNGMIIGTVASKTLKLETGDTTAVTIGTDQKVTLSDELVLGNSQGIYFTGVDTETVTSTPSKLSRHGGNATRFEYYNNAFIFDAKDNRPFEIRNQNDTPIFKVTVAGELADYDGQGGAANTNIENSIVAVNNGDLNIVNGALNVGGTERIDNAGNITGRDLTQRRDDGYLEVYGNVKHRNDLQVMNSTSDGWTTWLDRNNGTPNLQNINNVTMAGVLTGPSTFYIDPLPADTVDDATVDTGTVVIVGDLRVTGTTTTINSNDISIADKNLTLAQGSTQASDANGAGITVDIASDNDGDGDDNPTFTYTSADNSWNMNKDLRIATGDSAATFMVGRDLTDEYIKIEVQDLNNVITASQDSDANQPNEGDVSDHKFILNRTFAGTGNSDFVIQNAGTNHLIIDKNSYVGIGPSHRSPGSKLSISGTVSNSSINSTSATLHLDDTSNTAAEVGGSIVFTGAYTGSNGSLSAGPYIKAYKMNNTVNDYGFGLKFATRQNGVNSQAVAITIDSEQNVGIGTSSPTRELQVYRAAASVIGIKSDTGGLCQLALGDTDDDNYAQIILDNSTNKLQIQNGGGNTISNRGITLDSSENVGIGTASPSTALHIHQFTNTTDSTTGTTLLTLENDVRASAVAAGDIDQQKTLIDFIFKDDNSNEAPQVQIGAEVGGNSEADSQLKEGRGAFVVYTNDSDSNTGASSPAERLRVDYKGNVGIGDNNPVRKLEVAGTIGFKGLQGNGGVGSTVADFTKHTWIENNTSNNGATWHKVGTFTLPDNPYSAISLMVETVYPGSNHGGYNYAGHVWFNKVSVQRNGSTNGTVELDTGSIQGPESSKLRLHRNSVSEWELQIRSQVDNQALYADITQLSSAGGASFSLEQSITAGSTGGTTITSPHAWETTADNALTHTFGQLRTSGRIRSNGTIIANGVGSYDPDGDGVPDDNNDGVGDNDGVDTATNAAIAIPRGKRIVGTYDGYIRTLIDWNNNTNLNIGTTGTALLNNINLNSGHSGHVKIQNSRSAIAATEGGSSGSTTQSAQLLIKDCWNSSASATSDDWVVNQIIAAVEFDSSDSNGNSGGDSSPRGTINLVSETTDASATALTFGTKGDAAGAPSERLRITSAGNVGIGTTGPHSGTRMQICADDTSPTLSGTAIDDCTLVLSNSDHDYGTVFATDGNGKGYIQQRRTAVETYYDLILQPHGGNIGIGTDSPESLLNVVHQITANEYQYPLVVSGIDVGNTVNQTTSSGIGMQFKLASNDTDGESMPGAAIVAVRENENDDRNETSLVFQTSAHDQNLAGHVRIKSDGKVGIGTDVDPATNLEVSGSAPKLRITDTRSMTFTVGDIMSSLEYNSLDTSGGAGTSAEPRAAINMYAASTFGSSTGLAFYTKGDSSNYPSKRMVIDHTGRVGIATNDPKTRLQVESYGIDTTSTDTSAITQVGIATFEKAEFRSAKFMVQATNTTNSTYMVSEILLIHDGTTPSITEYGVIFTGSAREAAFDADISGDYVRLLATPASADDITFRVVSHQILV